MGRESTRKQVRGAIGKQRELSVASAALVRHDLCATVPNHTMENAKSYLCAMYAPPTCNGLSGSLVGVEDSIAGARWSGFEDRNIL